MPTEISKLFQKIETTITNRFAEASHIGHLGDRGNNREEILREFLQDHLPVRYGLTRGQVVTKDGKTSHSIDIIVYDRINCPLFYSGSISIVPVEGVYGIIEVKSTLTKTEFDDCVSKIAAFKKLAPREPGLIETREGMRLHRASRPFGIFWLSARG